MRSAFVLLFVLLTSVLTAQEAALPSIELPPELARVLRDYEKGWAARDAKALAQLFADDGFVLSNGKPPVRGRTAIEQAYAESGGPLSLRAMAYSTDGNTGYIIGGYASAKGEADMGKFILALKKDANGRWLIAADIDNSNQRPKRPAPPATP
ncbi:MAG TPA: nuclear transport factor 2 family protein [Thermoanaerobaculia bacterium]